MDILLSCDIIQEYFKEINNSYTPKISTDIINNNSNNFIINKNLIETYENMLKKIYGDKFDTLQPYLENIIMNKSIRVSSSNYNDCLDILDFIEKKYLANPSLSKSIFYSNISMSKNNNLNNKFSCNISNASKIDKNWLISELAKSVKNSITIHYYEFSNNNEIKLIFDTIYNITAKEQNIAIYDRQANFGHKLFDNIKQCRKIHYYTSKIHSDFNKKDDIKNNFKSVKLYNGNNNQIHERRIIIKDLFIEVNNDFWNIEINNTTWKIDITIDKETIDNIIKKNNKFNRIMN